MTIRSIMDDSAAMISRGLTLSRGLGPFRARHGQVSWAEIPLVRRMTALAETKRSRGWLVGLALVALALVVSLVLA